MEEAQAPMGSDLNFIYYLFYHTFYSLSSSYICLAPGRTRQLRCYRAESADHTRAFPVTREAFSVLYKKGDARDVRAGTDGPYEL